ncbi:hypothetical protein D3C72_1875810 [compost metagenome]
MFDTAFTAKLEADRTAVDLNMTAAQGGQAIGAVVPCILAVADANQGRIEQGDDRGHDFVATEARRGQH